jgi:hypothetical protein
VRFDSIKSCSVKGRDKENNNKKIPKKALGKKKINNAILLCFAMKNECQARAQAM